MGEATSAIRYFLDLLFKERNRQETLKKDISEQLRSVITEIEIYLFSVKRKNDRDVKFEQNIARLWSRLSADCAHYNEMYSDVFLEMSRFWSNPDSVPINDKHEYIGLIREILEAGREAKIMAHY